MPTIPSTEEKPLIIEGIRVRADRIEVRVRVSDKRFAYSDSWLAAQSISLLPTLADHACHNEKGPSFGCVIAHTSTPHLLEHMAIDLQTRACEQRGSSERSGACEGDSTCEQGGAIFTGTTQWETPSSLCALVSLSFKDDLVALASLKRALELLNGLLLQRAACLP